MKSIPLVNKPNGSENTIFRPVPVDLPGDSDLSYLLVAISTIQAEIEILQTEIRTLQQADALIGNELSSLNSKLVPMSSVQAEAGIEATGMLISPKVLADEIDRRVI